MSRLATVVGGDIRLQFRNGFYYAAGLMAMLAILALHLIDRELLEQLLPALIFSNLLMNTFYFIAGLVLLEKAEGTLWAQVVTPMPAREYLASKVMTLTGLAVMENLAIVMMTWGLGFRVLPLVAGMLTASAIYALVGFIVVARYDSINEYLFPSFLYTVLLSPPLLVYFGLWRGWWVYLHPMQAPLLLLKGAFFPIETWEWVYGLSYAMLWIGVAFLAGHRTFRRFVVAVPGVRE